MAEVEIDEFKVKGKVKKIIVIPLGVEGKDYTVKFGLSKARAVLEHIPEIKAFVESEGESLEGGEDGPC